MICVEIHKQNNKIKKIRVSGHSGYAKSGSDIVCAAVSSIVITSVNAILSIKNTIEITKQENPLELIVVENDEITEKLIKNMLAMLKEVEKEYAKYIRMEEKNEC